MDGSPTGWALREGRPVGETEGVKETIGRVRIGPWTVAVWDVAFVLSVIVLAVIVALGGSERARPAFIVAGGLTLAVTYIVFARKAFAEDVPSRTGQALLPLVALLLSSGDVSLATAQCILIPGVWVLGRSISSGVWFSLAVTLASATGQVINVGPEYALVGFVTFVISFAFSVFIGVWISSLEAGTQERQALIDQLEESRGRLAEASRIAGISAERERFSRELHDTVAQSLAGLVMQAESARLGLAAGRDVGPLLASIETGAREALKESRSLVAATAAVDVEGGLLGSLERLARRFERETGVAASVAGAEPRLSRENQVVAARVTQEALSNVAKHAEAAAVEIHIQPNGGFATLTIRDDGRGFDPAAPVGGFGLASMRDRVALALGTVVIESDGEGSRVVVDLPEEE